MPHPLSDVSLCRGFSTAEMDGLLAAARPSSVPTGQVVLRIGVRNASIFIIRSGSVVISRPGTEGDTVLAKLGAGRTFGEMSAVDGSLTSSNVIAAEATDLFELPLTAVDRLRAADPALWGNLWRNLALDLKERLLRTDELVEHYVDLAQVMSENPSLREQLGLA